MSEVHWMLRVPCKKHNAPVGQSCEPGGIVCGERGDLADWAMGRPDTSHIPPPPAAPPAGPRDLPTVPNPVAPPAPVRLRDAENEVESIARMFHETYERLAPGYGWKTQPASAVPWDSLPTNQRELMCDTVNVVLYRMWAGPAPRCETCGGTRKAGPDEPGDRHGRCVACARTTEGKPR